MNRKHLQTLLTDIAEEEIPSSEVALWANINERLVVRKHHPYKKEVFMRKYPTHIRRIQLASSVSLLLIVLMVATLATPQGRALAQEIMHFFTRANSDTQSVRSSQTSPASETTSNADNIANANLSVKEAERRAGFHVLEPSGLPKVLSFTGSTLEPDHHIVRIYYRYTETNGLVLREQPVKRTDDCELCAMVGASAAVETVQIGNVTGEYVEGVWKSTSDGRVWEPDPYLKTLRWQANGMAFELLYMGPPDTVTKADMIAVAGSLK